MSLTNRTIRSLGLSIRGHLGGPRQCLCVDILPDNHQLEILHFFIAEYASNMKGSDGGGLAHEQENIEVLEITFDCASAMIDTERSKTVKPLCCYSILE